MEANDSYHQAVVMENVDEIDSPRYTGHCSSRQAMSQNIHS